MKHVLIIEKGGIKREWDAVRRTNMLDKHFYMLLRGPKEAYISLDEIKEIYISTQGV